MAAPELSLIRADRRSQLMFFAQRRSWIVGNASSHSKGRDVTAPK